MEEYRIQDDLFMHVNAKKLEELVIPADKPRAGGFAELSDEVEKLMMAEFEEMVKTGVYPNDYLRRACALYKALKNVKKRNKDGIKPVLKLLSKIDSLTGIEDLNKAFKELVLSNVALPVDFQVEPDMKDSSKHCLMIFGPSIILPDTTYYKEGMEAQKNQLLGLWSQMAKGLLAHTELSEEAQALYIEDALKFDAVIATLVKSSEEWSEYTKAYNPMKTKRVCTYLKPLEFKKGLKKVLGLVPEVTVVADPRFLRGFSTLFNQDTFVQYKHWAYIKTLIGASKYLSEELRELGGMYQRALSGLAEMQPVDKFAYNTASFMYAEPVGLYYGEKYFGEAAKADVISMVKEIIEQYKVRIGVNELLAKETREKAILKLSTMEIKMGYPDKVEPLYDKLVFNENKSAYEIMAQLYRIRALDNIARINLPVDRTEWAMPGHLVNACYNPTSNDITFPAAILQAPFYSIKQTRSENLGGIGAVIAHEISHAFDNNGAQFDENGNINNWWTKEDYKMFNKKTKQMIEEFDGIELPWGKVNGTLIVSENIADNGGMAVTLDIMKHTPNSSYEEYFMNWARVWCNKSRPEFQALLLKVDVHAPAILRANMQPRNFPEWYDTFKVTKKDKMYLDPKKRVVVW